MTHSEDRPGPWQGTVEGKSELNPRLLRTIPRHADSRHQALPLLSSCDNNIFLKRVCVFHKGQCFVLGTKTLPLRLLFSIVTAGQGNPNAGLSFLPLYRKKEQQAESLCLLRASQELRQSPSFSWLLCPPHFRLQPLVRWPPRQVTIPDFPWSRLNQKLLSPPRSHHVS